MPVGVDNQKGSSNRKNKGKGKGKTKAGATADSYGVTTQEGDGDGQAFSAGLQPAEGQAVGYLGRCPRLG
jgi:hypothetical protein